MAFSWWQLVANKTNAEDLCKLDNANYPTVGSVGITASVYDDNNRVAIYVSTYAAPLDSFNRLLRRP